MSEIFGVPVDCILGIKVSPSIDVKGLDDEEIAIFTFYIFHYNINSF
ncbi:MAG: hypothetical protein LBC86_08135 [Oscillospiraceae bacterium]|nr:hypothetical protein [Oscillospiraceae bacterium]